MQKWIKSTVSHNFHRVFHRKCLKNKGFCPLIHSFAHFSLWTQKVMHRPTSNFFSKNMHSVGFCNFAAFLPVTIASISTEYGAITLNRRSFRFPFRLHFYFKNCVFLTKHTAVGSQHDDYPHRNPPQNVDFRCINLFPPVFWERCNYGIRSPNRTF